MLSWELLVNNIWVDRVCWIIVWWKLFWRDGGIEINFGFSQILVQSSDGGPVPTHKTEPDSACPEDFRTQPRPCSRNATNCVQQGIHIIIDCAVWTAEWTELRRLRAPAAACVNGSVLGGVCSNGADNLWGELLWKNDFPFPASSTENGNTCNNRWVK